MELTTIISLSIAIVLAVFIWKFSEKHYKKFPRAALGAAAACALVRLLSAIINKPPGSSADLFGHIQPWELWVYAAFLTLMLWWAFLAWRRKCPECKSFKYVEISRDLTDKDFDTEQTTSKTFRGKMEWDVYREREVTTSTFSVTFKCTECAHEWADEVKTVKRSAWKTTDKIRVQ